MFNGLRTHMRNRRFRARTIGAVSICFLMVGLMMGANLHLTGASMAEGLGSGVQKSLAPTCMPGSFSDLAKQLSPTVVNIRVTKLEKASGPEWPQIPEGPFGDFFNRFFREMPRFPENRPMQGAGSGVIISSDGYVLTNNHVVEGAAEVTVTLADKREYKARVVGRDAKTDLAVLKVEAKEPLPAAPMGDSDKLQIGDWVLAIGNPFGLDHTVTTGIVSAKGRVIGAGPYDDFIQTDASINPGNSGGPLFDMKGEVVGINTAIIPQGQGIGFAIPVNVARPLIPQLVTKGEVTRGYLGVSIQPVTPELAKPLKLEGRKGALVANVVPGSPAEKAGVQRGDLIVSFNKKAVEDPRDLSLTVAQTPVGQEATMAVLRDGVEHRLSVTVGKLESEKAEAETFPQPAKGKWGLWLQNLSPETANRLGANAEQGVVVVDVEPDSPAQRAGIQQGDIIVEVNRHQVNTVKDAKEAIAKGNDEDSLLLLVKRGQGSFFVALAA